MAIGYMTVEINEKGEPRLQKDRNGKEMLTFLDVSYELETEIHSEALEMIRASIPKDLKDVLILFTFNYEGHGGGYLMDDYEDWLVIESQLLLKGNYKEFYRQQVTKELEMADGLREDNEALTCSEKEWKEALELLVGEWEEFYDEDFTPTIMEKVAVEPLFFQSK